MLSERKDDPSGFHVGLHAPFRLAALAFVLFVVVGAFLIASYSGGTLADEISQTLQYLVSPWTLVVVAITVGFLAYGYVFLRAAPWKARDAITVDGLLRRLRLRLLLAMGLLTLGLVSIGAYFAFDLEREARQEALEQTRTIARLKAQQVDKWLYERATAAKHSGATLEQFSLGEWSSSGDVRSAVSVLFLQILDGHPERVAVTLFSPDGKALLHTGEDVAFGDGQTIPETSPKNRLRIVSTRLTGSTPSRPAVSIIVPIMTAPGAKTLAALLNVTIDPSIELLGRFQQWPTSSASGEALLVRREGEDVVYITPPRFLDPTKVMLGSVHVPLATEEFATAEALLHGDGVYEGPDYRGVEVLMGSFHIEGIDWRVIAKIERDEALRPAHRKIRTLAAGTAGALLLAGLMVALLWRGQRAGILAYRTQQETERGMLTQHYARMVASVRDAVFLTDKQGNIVEANEAAVKSYGYSMAEFQTMNAADLRTPEELPRHEQQWRPAVGQLGHIYQTIHRRKDGTTFPVEIANNAFEIDGTTYYQAFARDVHANRSLEVQLLRLSHLHKALFAATSTLLRARSEDELYKGMCDVIVDVGGYCLADVAVPNNDKGKTVRFLATAGRDDGYFAGASISWGDGPLSKGPTGAAIREGQIQVNQNFSKNPAMAPWRDAALKRGIQASVGLPLRAFGEVFGALTIYSDHPAAFDGEERTMLTRFAEDISFGVEALRRGHDPASSQRGSGSLN